MREFVRRKGLVLVVLVLAAALGAAGRAAAADEPQPDSLCAPGQTGVIYGTEGNDNLVGTGGDDVICGFGGNDQIDARAGNDVVDAGGGDDSVSGGTGDDRLFGQNGNDALDGATGNDGLWGGAGNDTLSGASGNDGLVGGDGDDVLSAASGDDSVGGEAGDDTISAASGNDTLDGGDGTDTLDAASGADICVNGERVSGCEQGAEALDSLPSPLSIGEAPPAAPNTITVAGTFPGVSLTVETGGGILSVGPPHHARAAAHGGTDRPGAGRPRGRHLRARVGATHRQCDADVALRRAASAGPPSRTSRSGRSTRTPSCGCRSPAPRRST